LPYAKQLLALAQTTLNELADNSPKGTLRLGTMEAVAATRLVEPLMKYHRQYPNVELEITTAPTADLINKVLASELDLALVADPVQDNRLTMLPIFKEKLVIVSDLAHQEIKSPEDLNKQSSLLGFSRSCAYRSRLEDWAKLGHDQVRVIEINSYHTLLSCVAAGMGVGIVPVALLDNYPFASSVKVHQLPLNLQRSVTSFIWRKDSVTASSEAFYHGVSGNI